MAQVIILNGLADHGQEMALYVDGKLVTTATIDGGNDCPETVNDYIAEFGVSVAATGITDIADLDKSPDVVTESYPRDEDDNMIPFPVDLKESEIAQLRAGEDVVWA